MHQACPQPDRVEVGHIPCGSGNDMIRNFGSADEFMDIAAMMVADSRRIDLIEANGRVAASICAAGLDAKVAYNIPLFRRLPLCGGSMAYDLSVMKCLIGKLDYHMTVECEEGTYEDDFLLAAIGNGSYYGGGYYSLPNALVDDGLLNVILVKKIPLWKIPPILARYKAGTHFAPDGSVAEDLKDILVSFSTKKIKVRCDREFYYTIDGECSATREVEVDILPGAARFILPYTTKGNG
jgi:diacylglycerol kinase (ATP)